MFEQLTQETLELIKGIQSGALGKNWTVSTGLVNFDLEAPAKKLYPVLTPVRNMLPRVKGNGGNATNWKAVTAININKTSPGVSEGNRGGLIATTVVSTSAPYAGIGLEDNVSFEAEYASQGFDDAKARAVEGLLRSVMIAEEKLILMGNATLALGVTPTPSLTASGSGTTLTATVYNVFCVALSFDGYDRASVAGGLVPTIARTNADSTSDTVAGGVAQISAAGSITPGAGQQINASVAAVKGAVAYAWFWGTPAGAANAALGAITTINSVVITAAAAGTQLANAAGLSADNSANALIFDGLHTQSLKTTGYYVAQATGTAGVGTPLTSDGAGGIVEIDVAFKSFWDNFRLSPEIIFLNSQELINITKKVIANGGSSLIRFVSDNTPGAVLNQTISAGAVVGTYLNKFTMSGGQMVKLMLHPNVPAGTIMIYSSTLPYQLSNVPNVAQMKLRQEYYQMEWPLRSRKYEYGVYFDGLLQVYAPFALGVIANIANG